MENFEDFPVLVRSMILFVDLRIQCVGNAGNRDNPIRQGRQQRSANGRAVEIDDAWKD